MYIWKKNYKKVYKNIYKNGFIRKFKIVTFKFFCHFFSYHIIMESWSLQGESIINDIRNLFSLRKELNYTAIKDIRNLFRQEKEIKTIKE